MAARVGIIAVAVYLIALVGAIVGNAGKTPVVEVAPTVVLGPRQTLGQFVGMSLNLYHTEHLELYLNAIDEMASMGFNTVHVLTPVFQRDGAADEIEMLVGPGKGPARDDLMRVLAHARSRGLKIVLMPQINFISPRGNEWRGKIQPDNWQLWWASYQRMILSFADLAQEAEVDMFTVGCELLTTQKAEHLPRWQRIISDVRSRFGGALTYSTNWDSYQKVEFWDQLDAIGISAYWDVTTEAEDRQQPTDIEIATRWQKIRNDVFAYANSQGRPALLTELGYPSLPWALRDPWNYIASDSVKADPAVQARGYTAFIRAWQDVIKSPATTVGHPSDTAETFTTPQARWQLPKGQMAGVLFYRWDPYYHGGEQDTGYGIVGKPAYKILKHWLTVGTLPPAE